jgi:hypothetical protein
LEHSYGRRIVMTVSTLIAKLQQHDPDLEVIIAGIDDVDFTLGPIEYLYLVDCYKNMSYDRVEEVLGITELTPHLIEAGFEKQAVVQGTPCLVLWGE